MEPDSGIARTSVPPPPPRKGLSTGGKVFLGCLGLFVVGGIVAAFALGAGALFVGKAARDVVAEVRGDGASGDLLRSLEERHAFEAPEDGIVGEARARRFAAAVEAAWVRIEPQAEALNASSRAVGPENVREALAGLRDGVDGLQGLRQGLADGLEEAGMSLKEFLWTSTQLGAGYRAIEMDSPPASVPPENIETAKRHAPVLANLLGGRDQTADRSTVLTVAMGAGSIFAFEEIFTR